LDGADPDRFGTNLTLRQPSIFVFGEDYGRRLVVFHKMQRSVAQAIFYGGHATTLELGSGEGVHGLLQWYRNQYLSYANQYYLWLAISQILANCQRRGCVTFA
jgi:hypothetical protein